MKFLWNSACFPQSADEDIDTLTDERARIRQADRREIPARKDLVGQCSQIRCAIDQRTIKIEDHPSLQAVFRTFSGPHLCVPSGSVCLNGI